MGVTKSGVRQSKISDINERHRMPGPKPRKPRDRFRLFDRRLSAYGILAEGESKAATARRVRCARGSLYRWISADPERWWLRSPMAARWGRPPKVDKDAVREHVSNSKPRDSGLEGEWWTTEALRAYLDRESAGRFAAVSDAALERYLRRLGLRRVRAGRDAQGVRVPGRWC